MGRSNLEIIFGSFRRLPFSQLISCLLFSFLLLVGTSSLCGAGSDKLPDNASQFYSQDAGASYSKQKFEPHELDELKSVAEKLGSVRVIIRLNKNFTPEGAMTASEASRQRFGIQSAQKNVINSLDSSDFDLNHRYNISPMIAAELSPSAVEALRDHYLVDHIYIDEVYQSSLQESIPHVEADQLHGSDIEGDNGMVVVLDTGIDTDHPAFGGRVVAEACFSRGDDGMTATGGDCPNGDYTQTGPGSGGPLLGADTEEHGTHVGGIAAGENTSAPSSSLSDGVAPGADIGSVMVFHHDEAKDEPLALTSDLLAALEHVSDTMADNHDVRAVNMSLGGGENKTACDDHSLQPIVSTLRSQGVATLIGSGNNGWTDAINAPACISDAIAVGAIDDSDDSILSDSNRDKDLVDLVAPGSSILSAIPDDGSGFKSGTSMATPHVAGAFTILSKAYSSSPDSEDVDKIEQALIDSGDTVTYSRSFSFNTYKSIRLEEAAQKLGLGEVTADFKVTDTPIMGVEVGFTDQSSTDITSISSWSWDFDDGSTSSQKNPVHTFDQSGTFTISLTVSGANGSTDRDTQPIYLNALPEARFSVSNTTPEPGESVNFSEDSSDSDGEIVSRTWDFGDGTTATKDNPSHTYSDSGTFKVELIVSDDRGETSLKRQNVWVGVYPTVNQDIVKNNRRTSDTTQFFDVTPRQTASFDQITTDTVPFERVSSSDTLADMANPDCTDPSVQYSFPLLNNQEDTMTACVWTNQSRFGVLYNIRSDSPSLNTSGLPDQISNTGIEAFSRTVFSMEFGDSTGTMIGDTVSTSDIGDRFAYTIRYHLSDTTVNKFQEQGVGLNDLRFYFADQYEDTWTLDSSVDVETSTSPEGGARVTVSGLTKDLPGGLGGFTTENSSDGGGCVIENTIPSDTIQSSLRSARHRLMETTLGRWITGTYYKWFGNPRGV